MSLQAKLAAVRIIRDQYADDWTETICAHVAEALTTALETGDQPCCGNDTCAGYISGACDK